MFTQRSQERKSKRSYRFVCLIKDVCVHSFSYVLHILERKWATKLKRNSVDVNIDKWAGFTASDCHLIDVRTDFVHRMNDALRCECLNK